MKSKNNKKIKVMLPNPSGNYFELGSGGINPQYNWNYNQQPAQTLSQQSGLAAVGNGNYTQLTSGKDLTKLSGSSGKSSGAGLGGLDNFSKYVSAASGAVGLINSGLTNLSTSGIGKEVKSTRDISRDDVLRGVGSVDSNQQNVLGAIAKDAVAGAEVGSSISPGWGTLIGGVAGALQGGITSSIGNANREAKAQEAKAQWERNINAKKSQYEFEDTLNTMNNLRADGGNLFAYGGNIKNNNEHEVLLSDGRKLVFTNKR